MDIYGLWLTTLAAHEEGSSKFQGAVPISHQQVRSQCFWEKLQSYWELLCQAKPEGLNASAGREKMHEPKANPKRPPKHHV